MPHTRVPRGRISRSHPLVATIRSLARSPEERAVAGLMLAEGVRLAGEALSERVAIREAIVSPRLERDSRGPALLAGLEKAGVQVRWADDALLASLHDSETHQGILLLVPRPEHTSAHLIPSGGGRALVLVALGVQDPGNMGALVRLADASGASSLLAAGGADPFGPKAVRASAGSIFRVPVLRVRGAGEAIPIIEAVRDRGLLIAGAVPRGGIDYREADLTGPLALILGGEGTGMPPGADERLDLRLTIPMAPRVESLNVAGAAAVLLFAASVRTPRALQRPASSRPEASGHLPAPSAGRRPRRR